MRDRYLKILQDKEKEAKANHEEAAKKALTAKSIYAAATRERMAFEEGMKA